MKTKTVKKLWNGFVSIRDYEVRDAIEEGGLIIKLNDKQMTLGPRALERGLEIISKVFISKTGGRNYKLIDFKWSPDMDLQSVGALYDN